MLWVKLRLSRPFVLIGVFLPPGVPTPLVFSENLVDGSHFWKDYKLWKAGFVAKGLQSPSTLTSILALLWKSFSYTRIQAL